MSYKIITHDGKAHLDEVLGSALLALHLGETPESVERLSSREAEEMAARSSGDKSSYFIDCGMRHDSSKGFFDHHQDKDYDSSALLIFNEFFPHLSGTVLHEFIKLVSRVDTRGAMSLDDFNCMGETKDYLYFGHNFLLRTFQEEPLLILKLVVRNLQDKIDFSIAKKEAGLWLEEPGNIEIQKVSGLKIINYLLKPPAELVSPLRAAISPLVDDESIAAILSFDEKRPELRTFYRTDFGHNLVDFSKAAPQNLEFCHPGGFLMKFTPADPDEWKAIIRSAEIKGAVKT